MALTKILPEDISGKGVVGLADTPGLSTADMQDKFDELVLEVVVPKHNAMADELTGTGGAAEIGTADGSNVEAALAARAKAADVLSKTNTEAFAPSADYHPATKKYVDDAVFDSGAADMRKAVYDTNDSGVVDAAENAQKLGGQLPSAFATAAQGLRADNAMPKEGGTFTGDVVACSTNRANASLRNIAIYDSTGATVQSTNCIHMVRK